MKTIATTALAAVALSAGPAVMAAEYTGVDAIASAGVEGSALDNVGYGASQYQTQYEIGDILSAVTEDIAQQLSAFLGRNLDAQEPEQTAKSLSSEDTLVSAY